MWERTAGKEDRLCRGHVGGLEQHRAVIEEAQGRFVAAVGGQALGRATIAVNDIYVETPLTGRGKGDALPVGTPNRVGVISAIGCQLVGRTALRGHREQVALVRECDGVSIG